MLVPSPLTIRVSTFSAPFPGKGEDVSGMRQGLRKSQEARSRGSGAC